MKPESVYRTSAKKEFREDLILEHLGFVRHIRGRISAALPADIDQENLEGAGVLGLVEAAHQFDPHRGVAFKTFAYPRIRGAMLDELRRNTPLSQKMLSQITRVREACESLSQPVLPDAIAKSTGMSLSEVERTIEAMRLSSVQAWDESKIHSASRHVDRHDGPKKQAEQAETQELLADAIQTLPDKERRAITLYYLEDLRLKEIGDVLGLSESRVSRLLAKAEFRVGQYIRANGG